LVENRANFIPHLYLAPPQGVTPSEFREHLDIHETRMNGLSCGEESRFDRVPACDRRTDRQTDVQPISITCSSIADARKYQYFRSDFKSKSKIIRVIKNHDFKSNDTGVNIS